MGGPAMSSFVARASFQPARRALCHGQEQSRSSRGGPLCAWERRPVVVEVAELQDRLHGAGLHLLETRRREEVRDVEARLHGDPVAGRRASKFGERPDLA
jgi:hypothetical protein